MENMKKIELSKTELELVIKSLNYRTCSLEKDKALFSNDNKELEKIDKEISEIKSLLDNCYTALVTK